MNPTLMRMLVAGSLLVGGCGDSARGPAGPADDAPGSLPAEDVAADAFQDSGEHEASPEVSEESSPDGADDTESAGDPDGSADSDARATDADSDFDVAECECSPESNTPGFGPHREGPWIIASGPTDGTMTEAGRLWVYVAAVLPGTTRVWSEFAERRVHRWSWLSDTMGWEVHIADPPNTNPHSDGDPEFLPWQQLDISTSNLAYPSATKLSTVPTDVGKFADYHQEGRYEVVAHFSAVGSKAAYEKAAWYYTHASSAARTRDEAYCTPEEWSWPKREDGSLVPPVSWTIRWNGAAAGVPSSPEACGALPDGTAAQRLQVFTVTY